MSMDQSETLELPTYKNDRVSKAETVYNYLKDGIIAGIWNPGDRINDKQISEHLGVNRLSVREALSRLIQDNIVIQIPWKGYSIRKVTAEEVVAFVEVRNALEQLALRDIFTKHSREDLAGILKRMEEAISKAKEFLASGAHAPYMEVDFSFHELLYEASGNPWIPKMIGDTRVFTNILRNISMGEGDNQFHKAAIQSIEDHRQIFKAIRDWNPDKAYALMEQHLMYRFADNIVKNYKQAE